MRLASSHNGVTHPLQRQAFTHHEKTAATVVVAIKRAKRRQGASPTWANIFHARNSVRSNNLPELHSFGINHLLRWIAWKHRP